MQKNNLEFFPALTNASGMLGFTPDSKGLPYNFAGKNLEGLGAFITNPISYRPRLPAKEPALTGYPGGLLLHTGHPNPGFTAVIKKYSGRWAVSRLPIIPHLLLEDPDEGEKMVRKLEDLENIRAIEISFESYGNEELILRSVGQCLGEIPLIVQLDLEQVISRGSGIIMAGASAVSFAPPRGSICLDADHITATRLELVNGRLYGPGLFPQSLLVLQKAVSGNIPVIAGVGVYSVEHAELMVSIGALAVQLDTCLWK